MITLVLAALAATRADAERQLREDDPAAAIPYIKNYLEQPRRTARPGQLAAHRRREPDGDIFDPKYLETLKQDPRRGVPDAGRRPRLGQVAVGAGRALDRSHRGGLPRRPGDARQLRRLDRGHRAAARQHRARRHRRQPGRQRLQVEHAGRAAARQRPEHRPAPRLPRALARDREDPRAGSRRRGRRAACTSSASPSWSAT